MSQSWFLKTPDGVSQANLRVFEKTKVRPVGPNKFGPWRVDISPDELKQQSYSYVYHRCHWLFPTITLFYEGKNA